MQGAVVRPLIPTNKHYRVGIPKALVLSQLPTTPLPTSITLIIRDLGLTGETPVSVGHPGVIQQPHAAACDQQASACILLLRPNRHKYACMYLYIYLHTRVRHGVGCQTQCTHPSCFDTPAMLAACPRHPNHPPGNQPQPAPAPAKLYSSRTSHQLVAPADILSAYAQRPVVRIALTPSKQLTLYLAPAPPPASAPSSSPELVPSPTAAPAAAAADQQCLCMQQPHDAQRLCA